MISFDNFSLSHEIDWQRNDRCMVMRFFWVKQSLVRKGQRHRDQRPSCKNSMCCKWCLHLNGHTEKKVSHNNGLQKRSKHTLTHSICNEMRREYGEPATAEEITVNGIGHCLLILTLTERRHISAFLCNKSLCHTEIKHWKICFWNLSCLGNGHTEKKVSHNNGLQKRSKHTHTSYL